MFTGVVTAVMVRRMRGGLELKAMEIQDLDGHILICGWNRQGGLMLAELQTDRELADRSVVLVAEFGEQLPLTEQGVVHERLYVVRGDPTRVDVLRRANATRASCAVLLADRLVDRLDQDRDARTILTALTSKSSTPTSTPSPSFSRARGRPTCAWPGWRRSWSRTSWGQPGDHLDPQPRHSVDGPRAGGQP